MGDKVYKVKVDKTNKLLLCVIELSILVLAFVCGFVIGNIFKLDQIINEIIYEVLILFFAVAFSILIFKLFPNILCEQEIEAEFNHDYVVLKKKKSKRRFYYKDITEVQKIMITDRLHEEKGYYRVRVKNMGRSYTLYSTEKEYDKHLDFEHVELSEVYFEFKRRGIKCC